MNIEQIGTDGIIISLCDRDMEEFDVTFESLSFSEEHSREVLKKLMYFASVKTGIRFNDKKVLIEAMRYDHGCILLMTVSERKQKRRVYRIKGRSQTYTFIFDDVESFIACIKTLYRILGKNVRSSAYLFGKHYCLVLHSAILEEDQINLVSEFFAKYKTGKLFPAILEEHAKKIASKQAVGQIGCHFCENK